MNEQWETRVKGYRRYQIWKGWEVRLPKEHHWLMLRWPFALATWQVAFQSTWSEGDLRCASAGWPLMLHSSCQQLCLGELILGFYGFHSHFLLHFFLVFWRNSNLVEITVSYRLRVKTSKEIWQNNGSTREETLSSSSTSAMPWNI